MDDYVYQPETDLQQEFQTEEIQAPNLMSSVNCEQQQSTEDPIYSTPVEELDKIEIQRLQNANFVTPNNPYPLGTDPISTPNYLPAVPDPRLFKSYQTSNNIPSPAGYQTKVLPESEDFLEKQNINKKTRQLTDEANKNRTKNDPQFFTRISNAIVGIINDLLSFDMSKKSLVDMFSDDDRLLAIGVIAVIIVIFIIFFNGM